MELKNYYMLDDGRIRHLITEVADNLAFKKMYNDISCITLTYCRVYWTDFNRLEGRYESLLQTIEAIEKMILRWQKNKWKFSFESKNLHYIVIKKYRRLRSSLFKFPFVKSICYNIS